MWKAIKWQGRYLNVYVSSDNSLVKVMYPPKEINFKTRHMWLMGTKGYSVIEERDNIVTYTIGGREND